MKTGRPPHAGGVEERRYRDWFSAPDVSWFTVVVEQTDLRIGIGQGREPGRPSRKMREEARQTALEEVRVCRETIKARIRMQPEFLTALAPVEPVGGEDALILQMLAAGQAAGVGPMAAVAGAVAEQVGRRLSVSYREVIVENGGDLWMCGTQPRVVGIWCGTSVLNGKLALRFSPGDLPMGLCTSSGTIGHSLSFGHADAATVSAQTAALADAVATALGNRIQTAEDLEPALTWAMKIPGVQGVLAVLGARIGIMGAMTIASGGDAQQE